VREKIIYVLLNLVGVAFAAYKANSMGLLASTFTSPAPRQVQYSIDSCVDRGCGDDSWRNLAQRGCVPYPMLAACVCVCLCVCVCVYVCVACVWMLLIGADILRLCMFRLWSYRLVQSDE